MPLKSGDRAPDFALAGSDGRVHTLADYAGQTLILYFYPKDNTPGCSKEACAFRDLQNELCPFAATVLGVSRDSLASHDRFIKNFNLPFLLLSDPDARTLAAYGAWGEKTMYGKKVTGVIRSTVLIRPDGTIGHRWPAVKKAGEHPAEVLAWLKAQQP